MFTNYHLFVCCGGSGALNDEMKPTPAKKMSVNREVSHSPTHKDLIVIDPIDYLIGIGTYS